MERIAIIGSPGAGKTNLALALSTQLNIPVIHLDKHFWQANWSETPREAWIVLQENLFKAETWIADGNYGGTLDLRLSKADTIIYLDYSRWLCSWRVIKRVLKYYSKTRPDMAEGCKERFDFGFMRYIWQFPKKHKPRILEALGRYPDKTILTLTNPKETKHFLRNLER